MSSCLFVSIYLSLSLSLCACLSVPFSVCILALSFTPHFPLYLIEKSCLLPLVLALGSRLLILDDIKGTVESCGPLGEDHQILIHYQKTEPVDVEWYGGSPLWTDDSSYRGIGFMAKRGGPSTGITSLNQFQKATGIHVYYGEYPRIIILWSSRGTVVH